MISRTFKILGACALGISALSVAATANAQAIDAGDYVPAPAGTQLGLIYLQYSHAGALYQDGKKVDDKAELDVAVSLLRYVGFTKVAGMTLDYQVLQPYGHIAGGGSTAGLGKTSGFGDTILVSTLWVHEDPKKKSFFGITPYLFIPTGEYNASKALNLGENRWKGSLQAVYSQGFGDHFIAELAGDAMIFGKNDNLGPNSDQLTQKPLFRVQGFARYLLDDKNEINARLMHVTGGETKINGVEQNNITKTTSVLGTWRHTISPEWQIMTQVGTDIAVHNGFKEGIRGQLRLLKVF